MFEELGDLSYRRTWKQAFGFYLVAVVTVLLLAIFVGFTAVVLIGARGWIEGADAVRGYGTITGAISSVVLSCAILRAKRRLSHLGYLGLAIIPNPRSPAV